MTKRIATIMAIAVFVIAAYALALEINVYPVREEGVLIISTPNNTSSGTLGHDSLFGLTKDDHVQYLLIDGTRPMTGTMRGPGVDVATADVNNTLTVDANTVCVPLDALNITAIGGITINATLMRISGNGGVIDISAVPQIAAGTDGQFVVVMGESDVNTVQVDNGDGVHLHGGSIILGNHDSVTLIYDTNNSEWEEVTRNSAASEKAWAFRSRSGASGTSYAGGYYNHASSSDNFGGGPSFGTANSSYAAHFFVVTGEDTVDELTLTVTGTSITDTGTRSTSDTENIVIPNATTAGAYYETAKKWLGAVVITVASGTAKLCDHGYAKYWDNNNTDFRVLGLESTWLAGATDTAPNLILRHHKGTAGNTDWTYTGTGATPPTPMAAMATDHSVTEDNLINGEIGAWKRTDLNVSVSGSGSEGTILEVVTSANRAFELGNFLLRVRPD